MLLRMLGMIWVKRPGRADAPLSPLNPNYIAGRAYLHRDYILHKVYTRYVS